MRSLRQNGFASIDVGCFQINLLAHPGAFATLEDGFDPSSNAVYAARFLNELRARTGSWDQAVAAYHSATPALGEPYRARVYARWTSGEAPPRQAGASVADWNRLLAFGPTQRLPIRVIVPSASLPAGPAGSQLLAASVAAATPSTSRDRILLRLRNVLPRVFTPSRS